jgi:Tol biopolymer transport system component
MNVQPLAWSPDGRSVLVTSDLAMPERHALMLWPIAAAPHADTAARQLAFDPRSDLWQGSFSPNGRWLSFTAIQTGDLDGASVLCTIPSTGASPDQWTRLTDVHAWADKPRWSPDGKVIYFWLLRGSLVNVWALRFDDVHGRAIGAPFQVTHFDSPARHISAYLGGSEPSVSLTTLLLPMTDASGSIWMLDNVDR